MKSYSLREAWNFVDSFGELKNVYDSYVLKEDWTEAIDRVEQVNTITEDLLVIEKMFGITDLRNKQELLYNKVRVLELPIFGYKYNVPIEIENEIKLRLRETKHEINEIEAQIEKLLDQINVDPEILNLEN